MKTSSKKEKGLSTIAVVAVMLVLSFFGTAVVYQLGTSQAMRINQVLADSAFYVTQAGLEYAVRQIYEGELPVVAEPGKDFGEGNFVISQAGQVVTVTGRVGESTVVHTMTSPTQADCTELDVSNANLSQDGTKVSQIRMRKLCLTQTVVTQILLSWDADDGERVKKIRIESTTLYDDPIGTPSGQVIDIADYTLSNPNEHNFNEIKFDSDMEDKTVTLTLVFGDTTTKSGTFELDDD